MNRVDATGAGRVLPDQVADDLLRSALQDVALDEVQIMQDYWLHVALLRLHTNGVGIGSESMYARRWPLRPLRHSYDVLFAGGTSLVSQWGLSQRYSEDVDLLFLPHERSISRAALAEARSDVARACVEAADENGTCAYIAAPHPMLTQAFASRGGTERYLKVDVSEADRANSPYALLPVRSLLGRYADEQTLAAYPELGGFELPALHYTVTAGNKMRAMVDNCDRGRVDQIRSRARDLFDLAGIAASPDAAQDMDEYLRAAEITAGARSDAAGQHAAAVARFADNPALTPGTAENAALREGYADVVERLAWQPDEAPPFDQAATAAQSLTA